MAAQINGAQMVLACAAFLPGNPSTGPTIATGVIATQALNCKCTKLAGKGQWLIAPTIPLNTIDGSTIIMIGPGIPSDSNSGISVIINDNGNGTFNLSVFDVAGAAPSFQSVSFTAWTFPKTF